ncbi:hypothetical protein HDU76_006830, partial [Blyttiomyces sp. JEL0837]
QEILPKLEESDSATAKDGKQQPPYEFYFGIPTDIESDVTKRVSPLHGFAFAQLLYHIIVPEFIQKFLGSDLVPKVLITAFTDKSSLPHKALFASGPRFLGEKNWPWSYNDPVLLRGVSPSFNGLTNSRTLARVAAFMANNGTLNGVRLLKPETVAMALETFPRELDVILQKEITFTHAGWGKIDNIAEIQNVTMFGWAGAGGSMFWWDPTNNIAFSYVMNFCHVQSLGDKRSHRLLRQIYHVFRAVQNGVDLNASSGGKKTTAYPGGTVGPSATATGAGATEGAEDDEFEGGHEEL